METIWKFIVSSLFIATSCFRGVHCAGHNVCSSSYSLPTESLGLVYEVLTWPPDDNEVWFSVVASTSTSTRVRVRLPPPSPVLGPDRCVIWFESVQLDCGQTLEFSLLNTDTVRLTSTTTDLSGTLVEASMPVAVYAGSSDSVIGPSNVADSTAEQLFPVSAWGREFVVAPVPINNGSGYAVRVSCSGAVNVSVAVDGVVRRLTPHRALTVDVADNRAINVDVVGRNETAVVQLVQFVRGATVTGDSGAPAAVVIPAVDRFTHNYTFTDAPGFTRYVSVVIRPVDVSGLRLNDLPLNNVWTTVGDWVTGAVQLDASTSSRLEHVGQRPFASYVYGFKLGQCAFAYPAGAAFTSQPTANPFTTVTPRPTQPSEVGCVMDNMGNEFAVAFINNVDDNVTYQLEIYPTSFARQPSTDVTLQLVDGTWQRSVLLPSSQSVMVDVPPDVELKETEMSRKAVIVTTDDDQSIGVYAMSSAKHGSCDGFVALPVVSLGVDYFTLSFWPPDHESEIGIIALHNATSVRVLLNSETRPGVEVIWNQTIYVGGDSFTINMNRYDTVQLQSQNELSGTRITSNKPIAVFSGNNDLVDGVLPQASHLVEQLPPVNYWGRTFYLLPLPGVAGYTYKMMTAQYPNDVTHRTPTGGPSTVSLNHPGASERVTATQSVVINASHPLLVAQFGGSSESTFPRSMMLVPPAELFRSWYTLATGHSDFDNFTHYLILIANRSAVDGLRLDGRPVDTAGWIEFDATGLDDTVGRQIPVSSGVHVVFQLDGVPFGAYVYGHSDSNCAYSFAAGLCLGSPNNLTTYPPVTPPPVTPTDWPNATFTYEISDCTCLTVTSVRQPDYSGQFHRHSTATFNDRPYYIRARDAVAPFNVTSSLRQCDSFLYALTEEVSYWMIGPRLGDRQGAIVGVPVFPEPYDVTSWRTFSDADGDYVDDNSTSVACSCPVLISCKSTELVNKSTGGSPLNGVFTLMNTSYSGRPVYRHQLHSSLYLYYSQLASCSDAAGAWIVGEGLGVTASTSMFLADHAHDPMYMSTDAVWMVYDRTTKQFLADRQLTLVCYVPSQT